MLKIATLNVNGIRSAFKKNFLEWLELSGIDIICMQEIRISKDKMNQLIYNPGQYNGFFFHANKKGYSGVGVYVKNKILSKIKLEYGMNHKEMDHEGRIMKISVENLSIFNIYLPSGSYNKSRQEIKFKILNELNLWLDNLIKEYKKNEKSFIICGDLNIAHKEIDIKNWKKNINNPGFLLEEREWLDNIFYRKGLIDVFRKLNKSSDQYTWWSNRGDAWNKNVGWRIDYQIATSDIANLAINCNIYKDKRFSDHAPLVIEYNI